MKVLITICGRGGSKGIPGKNIREINGKPLIAYSIAMAKKVQTIWNADLALSTDSDDIKAAAAQFGLPTNYTRPAEFATDKAGKIDVLRDVLLFTEKQNNTAYDYLLDLDITSPLRTVEDIQEAFAQLEKQEDALNIFSVSPANRNPYFNMVEKTDSGFVKLVKDGSLFKSRQEAPEVYDMNASFYIYRRQFFTDGYQGAITSKSLAYVMRHVCFDLDHPIDFTMMELLMKNNLLEIDL